MAFFQSGFFPDNRPMRRNLPIPFKTFTFSILTFKACSAAFLISTLFASERTKRPILRYVSRNSVNFSVRMGLRMMSCASRLMSRSPAAGPNLSARSAAFREAAGRGH